jgi:Calcineurin-like phosphoesterase
MKNIALPAGLKWFLAIATLVVLAVSAPAAPWSFVVTGDGRTNPKNSPDPTGVNVQAFTNLLHAIITTRPAPQFLMFSGDLVSGVNTAVTTPIADQFKAWQELSKAAAPGLTILPFRGNHETYGDPAGAAWRAMFTPGLDANKVTYLPGEEGFSYSYAVPGHPEALVIVLDQFLPGKVHRVNLAGLENVLQQAKANHVTHVFVMAHEMAFTCTSHGDSDNMAAFPDERDQFVNLLQRYGCEYFFAGHDHAFDWMAIRHPNWPTNYTLNQIVCGTAGAPFYPDKGYYGDHHGFDLTRLDHRQNTLGFLLVTVDDSAAKPVTVTFQPVASK